MDPTKDKDPRRPPGPRRSKYTKNNPNRNNRVRSNTIMGNELTNPINASRESRKRSTSSIQSSKAGLPPRHTNDKSIASQASGRRISNSTSVSSLSSMASQSPNNIRFLSDQLRRPNTAPTRLTALSLLQHSNSLNPDYLISFNLPSSISNQIERIQQNLTELRTGRIILLDFQEQKTDGNDLLLFIFKNENENDQYEITYNKTSRDFNFFILTSNGAVYNNLDTLSDDKKSLLKKLKDLIKDTIWNKITINGKEYVLFFGKKSYQNAYLERRNDRYEFIDFDYLYALKKSLALEAVSMEEDYEDVTFFTDLEKDLESMIYRDLNDGNIKVVQNEANRTWTYKKYITFSVDADYNMTNITIYIKRDEEPSEEKKEDTDADVNLIKEKLTEMKSKRGF